MSELKKCPFCGGELKAEGKNFYMHPIVGCLMDGTLVINCDESKKSWNTRRPVDDVVEALEENAFPDFEEEYTCNGAELLFLSDAIQIIKEKLN